MATFDAAQLQTDAANASKLSGSLNDFIRHLYEDLHNPALRDQKTQILTSAQESLKQNGFGSLEIVDDLQGLLVEKHGGKTFLMGGNKKETEIVLLPDLTCPSSRPFALAPESTRAVNAEAAYVARSLKNSGRVDFRTFDHAFDLAVRNRAECDLNGKEVMQTMITAINNELAGTGYSITTLNHMVGAHSRGLTDFMRAHPNAVPMAISKSGRGSYVYEYAYAPQL